MEKDVTIVIVNWNTRDMLDECLQSIKSLLNFQKIIVIVVDNQSKDGSQEMVISKYPFVKLINSPGNIGFARGNNLAAPFTNTEYVLLLNPDTIINPDTILKMIEFMKSHSNVGLLGCAMRNQNNKLQELGIQWFPSPFKEFIRALLVKEKSILVIKHLMPYHDPMSSGYVKKLYGGCLFTRKSIIDKVGWFDKRFFMYAEDVDLSLRVNDLGYRLYYASDIEIMHFGGGASSKAGNNFGAIMKAQSTGILIKKYYGSFGSMRYRFGILIAAITKAAILYAVELITPTASKNLRHSTINLLDKNIALIKWSLNITKPAIRE